MTDDRHIPFINYVANEDAEGLVKAEESYAGSWKKRGGVGAFMMLARKWDRLEARAEKHAWDIFDAIQQDERSEGVIDDVRDLRRYLNLVESEMIARGAASAQSAHRDNAEPEYNPDSAGDLGAMEQDDHLHVRGKAGNEERIKGRQAAAREDALREQEELSSHGVKTMPLAQRQMPELPRDCTAKEYEDLSPRDRQKYVFKNGRYWLKNEHHGERRSQ
jgi:hypothetical protein